MPNLDALLKDTLLLTAAPGAPWTDFGGDAGSASVEASAAGADLRWGWTHDPENPGQVTQVTYHQLNTPWYFEQKVEVLDELVWHPLELMYRGTPLTLEFSREFLLRRYEASSGSIVKDQARYWIPTDIDRSMMLVFGFQVNLRGPSGSITLEPIPPDVLSREDFMPAPDAPASNPKPTVMKVKRTELGTLQLIPLRVLVCAEFVCCKERDDYLPGALARTARFRPHLMIMSNRPLERMAAKVSIRRPSMSSMAHNQHGSPHGVPDDQDTMHHSMSTGMWMDSNNTLGWDFLANMTVPPLWSSLFARVKTGLPAGAGYLMVTPEAPGGAGPVVRRWDAVKASYVEEQLNLMPRQGYFDNIHMAPPMRAPQSIINAYPDEKMRLETITMAPFCIHDCLHLHWRWCPTKKSENWLWGWDETGPYAEPGHPLIPVHQHLRVEMESSHAFAYSVHASKGLEAGRWQYVLHEGLAYGTNTSTELLGKWMLGAHALLALWGVAAMKSWAMFYWTLRFWRDVDRARDRILEDGAPDPAREA